MMGVHMRLARQEDISSQLSGGKLKLHAAQGAGGRNRDCLGQEEERAVLCRENRRASEQSQRHWG